MTTRSIKPTRTARATPRHALTLAVGLVLAATCAPAGALDLSGPGNSATVKEGSSPARWRVQDGATLFVEAGGMTYDIDLNRSNLVMTGGSVQDPLNLYAINLIASQATLDGVTVRSGRIGLHAGTYLGYNAYSSAVISNSDIQGDLIGVIVNEGSRVSLSATRVSNSLDSADYGAITSTGGNVQLTNGSSAVGWNNGFTFLINAEDSLADQGQLLVDGSSIEGQNGSAIRVLAYSDKPTDVTILARNGARLTGSNGDLLTVEQGRGSFLPTANFIVESTTLDGNVTANDGATANVTLRNGGRINGVFNAVSQATVGDSGYWQLTGDSSVANVDLRSGGAIELGNGSAFNTLNVSGDFTGSGGTVLFNTVLAGDDAATDTLVIGGDTSGQTNVRVNNVGGAGAQTERGIELINVAGASNGQFDLAGRAVGGQYEYFLFKDAGNWYLRSQLPTTPDPCDADPTLPGCTPVDPGPGPEPVLRPEPGAYLANLQAAQGMFRIGYHDRNAGQNGGRGWARVDGSRNAFDAVSQQLDVHGNSQALSVGVDVLRNDNGSAFGVMLATGNANSTSTNALTGYYARGKAKGAALGVYGTWRAAHEDPYAGFYVDGSLQRAQFSNRVEGIGLETERYDSRAWQGAVETGYAFRVGGASNGGVYVEPQLQLGYNRWDNLHHTEANGTVVTTQDADGLFGRAGVRVSGVTRWGGAAAEVQPYVAAHWLHTQAQSQIRMDDEVVDAHIPRNRAEVGAGASLKFVNGWRAWAGVARQQANGYHQTSAQLGLGYDW